MLDIVAPDQDEAATPVDRRRVDHRKTRLAPTRGRSPEPLRAEAARHPGEQPDQSEHEEKGEKEAHRKRHLREETLQHGSSLRPRGGPFLPPPASAAGSGKSQESPEWLT